VAGLPIARIADRWIRRSVIAIGLAIWSAMTAMSGLVSSFPQLTIARIGVGIGEAGCTPPAHSLLSDYFPPERRATAMAIYSMGIHVGAAVGLLLGGWINEIYGWRTAFFVVGLPGVVLAILVRLTVREPPRGHSEGGVAADVEAPTLGQVAAFLWPLRSFWHLAFGAALHSFAGYGVSAWLPAFLIRVHGMGTGEIGTWLSMIFSLGGATGSVLGGVLADRLGAKDRKWILLVPAVATIVQVPVTLAVFLVGPKAGALAFLVPSTLLSAMWFGPIFGATQSLVKPRMRALASAILLFLVNLIGLGLGPQLVGVVNDALQAQHGDYAIRYSLMLAAAANLWAGAHFLLGSRSIAQDLQAKFDG